MVNSSFLYSKNARIEFSIYDYSIFTFMISLSVIIGIYFGYFGKKQTTASEYLLGGKTMRVFPIAMSLVASNISSIAMVSIPADVYKFGATVLFISISHVIGCVVAAYITVPVFHKLQITSTYEYLMLRFNNKLRIMGSLLYNMNTLLYLPIVIYGPALALSQVTPVNLLVINPILCAICIFYTTIGGFKSVVWTDNLQLTAMIGALIAVLGLGLSSVGGFKTVIDRAIIGERLNIDFDIDPTKRDTFWAIILGWTLFSMPQIATNQGSIQKFLSLPSLSNVRQALLIYGIGTILFKSASILSGLIMFAKYYNCDPFTIKQVEKDDQLLPFHVMDVASSVRGLPGLFIAGVFCASLSTLSAHMNSLSGLIYEDFVSRFVPKNITEKQVSNILKILVVIIGIISTSLVFVVRHLGGLFEVGITLSGISAGPLLGLFILGMMFPSANSKGALIGSITSLVLTSFIVVSNRYYKAVGAINYMPKPLSAEGCVTNSTILATPFTTPSPTPELAENVFVLFRITHYYNTLIGIIILLAVGLPVSWLTKQDKLVNKILITPVMHWAMPKNIKQTHNGITAEELCELNKKI